MVRSERIAEILRQRLAAGDYDLRQFPAERDLAAELGASYLTARKAVQQLIVEGLLERSGRGRAVPVHRDQRPLVAFLTCDWPALWALQLREGLETACAAAGLALRCQTYLHWDDPCIGETLQRAVGVVFVPRADDPPERLRLTLAESRARVLVSSADLGLPGVRILDRLPAGAVRLGLDHLAACGHRRVTVFNLQPLGQVIGTRLDEARAWARQHPAVEVELAGSPVTSGELVLPSARRQARALLAGAGRPQALLALTLPAAQGALRAAVDLGLRPGADLAVAAIDGEDLAEDLVPSITSVDLDPADLARVLAEAVAWMAGGEWPGPALHACRAVLHPRESTRAG